MSEDSSKHPTSPRPNVKNWTIFSSIALPIGAIFAGGLITGLIAAIAGIDPLNTDFNNSMLLAGMGVLLPGIILVWFIQNRGYSWGNLGFSKKLIKPSFIEIFKNLGLYLVTSLSLLIVVGMLAPSVDLSQDQDLGFDNPVGAQQYFILFILLAVLTPIIEEILFRGFMFKSLKFHLRWLDAAIISALIFGLAHGQLNVGIDTAVMGFYSARLLHKTGNLLNSILLHATKNTLAFMLLFIVS